MRPVPSSSNSGCVPLRRFGATGFSLIEVLIALAVMGVISTFIFPSFWQFQEQGFKEMSKNDLYDRGQRLGIYLGQELSMAGFLLGRRPDPSIDIIGLDDADPDLATSFDATIAVSDKSDADDEITILKAESFFPKLTVTGVTDSKTVNSSIPTDAFSGFGANNDRRRHLGVEADTAYSRVAFENHKRAYLLIDPDNGLTIGTPASGKHPLTFHLDDDLRENLSTGSEIFKVRAKHFKIFRTGTESRLLVDDGRTLNPRGDILDRAVDGLQLRYLLDDGSWADNPDNAEDIRAIRFYLLVRAVKAEKGLKNSTDYSAQMGNASSGTYGPYDDAFRRLVVVKDVEVKNYAAR